MLFVSAYNDLSYLHSAIKFGAVEYLTKPIDFGEFDQVMQRVSEKIKKLSRYEERLQPMDHAAAWKQYFASLLIRNTWEAPQESLQLPADAVFAPVMIHSLAPVPERSVSALKDICLQQLKDVPDACVFMLNSSDLCAVYPSEQTDLLITFASKVQQQLIAVLNMAVNQLSREIVEGKHESIEDVERCLREIDAMPAETMWAQVLASGAGSGLFCVLAGGGLAECVMAFIAGFLLYIYVLKIGVHLSKIVGNIIGGALVVQISLLCRQAAPGLNLSAMISGTIMPLVSGVAFTNGIRDIANSDYLSGVVRLLDAVLVFISIAIGVGVMFSIYHGLTGGIMP